MRLLQFFDSWSEAAVIIFGMLLIVLLGLADFLTGFELSFSIFYLIPIVLVSWRVGERGGMGLAAAAAAVWLTADLLGGHVYSSPFIPYWNALVRLGFFLIVNAMLSRLQASRRRQGELGQFIVHDLRSPLGVMITGLQALREELGEAVDASRLELIELSLASGDRMLILINSLLDLARLESGQMPLTPARLEPEALLAAAVEQVSLLARRKQVAIRREIDGAARAVTADPIVTGRILNNLLSNALKVSPGGGEITIRVRPEGSGMLAFSIADQGRGIAREMVDRVFDKFTQAGAESRRSGSGLGLTFCRLAVEAQGGRIWAESEVGAGSTFVFTLPLDTHPGGAGEQGKLS